MRIFTKFLFLTKEEDIKKEKRFLLKMLLRQFMCFLNIDLIFNIKSMFTNILKAYIYALAW
jgi:hypothetical protein